MVDKDGKSTGSPPPRAAKLRQEAGDPPTGQYLTLQELAAWLKISRASAWSLVMERGEIPYLRFGDRLVRLEREDVEAYLRRCRSDTV